MKALKKLVTSYSFCCVSRTPWHFVIVINLCGTWRNRQLSGKAVFEHWIIITYLFFEMFAGEILTLNSSLLVTKQLLSFFSLVIHSVCLEYFGCLRQLLLLWLCQYIYIKIVNILDGILLTASIIISPLVYFVHYSVLHIKMLLIYKI